MAPELPRPFRRIASWRVLFVGTVGIFALSVLVQAFFAGDAAVLAPEMWQKHVAWVHIFQWLSVALPVTAHLAGHRIGFTFLNCLPLVMVGLQYMLIHFAINHGRATYAGLHAVGGVLLFGLLVFVFQEWRNRAAAEFDGPLPE
jgi:Family of unknown function (DUF6220)